MLVSQMNHMMTMMKKTRKTFNAHRLLSLDIAKMIRYHKALYPEKPLSWFADKFQTSPPQISRILNNKIWQEK